MSTRYVALFLAQDPGTHRDYLRIPSPIVGKDLYLRTTDVTWEKWKVTVSHVSSYDPKKAPF